MKCLFYAPGPTQFRHAMPIGRATGVPPVAATSLQEVQKGQKITGNKGNAIHAEAPAKLFRKSDQGSAFVDLPGLYKDSSSLYVDSIEKYFDTVVVSMANFIRPKQNHENLLAAIRALPQKTKLIVLGAGLQELVSVDRISPSTLALCKEFSNRAALFGVRGEDTQSWLNDQGIKNTIVLGCPSMYVYPLSIFNLIYDGIPRKPKIITAGHLSKSKLTIDGTSRGRRYAEVFAGLSADYVFQDEPFSFDPFVNEVGFYNEGTGALPAREINEYLSTLAGHSINFGKYYYFLDTAAWRQMCTGYDLYVGDRFHAGVAAIQAQIPTLILTQDQRVRELTAHFGIPNMTLKEASELGIESAIKAKLNKASLEIFKKTYSRRLQEFCTAMNRVGIEVVSQDLLPKAA